MSAQQGLTLIELMAVVAVIGILASVTTLGFTNIRERSALAATTNALEIARTGAAQCMLHGKALEAPEQNTLMCDTVNLRWPELGRGWRYNETYTSEPNSRTYTFSAEKVDDPADVCVRCTQEACEPCS